MVLAWMLLDIVAGYGFWRRIRLWRCGQPVARFDRALERLGMVVRHALLQMRTARQAYANRLRDSLKEVTP